MYILECKYNIYQYFLYGFWWAGGPVGRLRICRGPPGPPTVYASGLSGPKHGTTRSALARHRHDLYSVSVDTTRV
jgi:hypothetical protein